MRKSLGIVIALLVIGGVAYVALRQTKTVSTIDQDTTVNGPFTVPAGHAVTFRNGATLTVNGDFELAGKVTCADGPVHITVGGAATLQGSIVCDRPTTDATDLGLGISLVVAGSLELSSSAVLSSNGHIQLVSKAEDLATTPEQIAARYQDAATDNGAGNRIGPFVPEGAVPARPSASVWPVGPTAVAAASDWSWWQALVGIPAAQATSHTVVVGGRIRVGTPPPGVRQIVVLHFPDAAGMTFQNFEVEGPDGRDGASDQGNSCNARGKDGEDAFRMLVRAPNLTINNFTVKLGSGGNGGDAETKNDCKPGVAVGGKGGQPGNFKMLAEQNFAITGKFTVFTGVGGAGGTAIAHGKDGGPSEDGGDAIATGGAGADNVKKLSISGTVSGVANVKFDSAWGGPGGEATAQPGKGGNGDGCGKKGGNGGNATATGGQGGKASLTVTGGAGRTATVDDAGGDGGDATATGAVAGNGGSCGPDGPGGNGGKGGDATAKPGKGGTGTTRNGADGTKQDETGGNGGNGGDGCPPGKGGNGGSGNPPGQKGADGKNTCVPPKENQTGTTGGSETTNTNTNTSVTPPVPPPETISVQVIQYQGKYLPISQLIVESEQGCDGGTAHYHAAQGLVVATDGTRVPDPGPQCGYGKVSERPTMTVQVQLD